MELLAILVVRINHKRIPRLMQKYSIVIKIRRNKSLLKVPSVNERKIVAHKISTGLHTDLVFQTMKKSLRTSSRELTSRSEGSFEPRLPLDTAELQATCRRRIGPVHITSK